MAADLLLLAQSQWKWHLAKPSSSEGTNALKMHQRGCYQIVQWVALQRIRGQAGQLSLQPRTRNKTQWSRYVAKKIVSFSTSRTSLTSTLTMQNCQKPFKLTGFGLFRCGFARRGWFACASTGFIAQISTTVASEVANLITGSSFQKRLIWPQGSWELPPQELPALCLLTSSSSQIVASHLCIDLRTPHATCIGRGISNIRRLLTETWCKGWSPA